MHASRRISERAGGRLLTEVLISLFVAFTCFAEVRGIGECSSDPCQNGGMCVMEGINEFSCLCVVGYTGLRCEIDYDECCSNPCQNGALCTDGVYSYVCDCPAGYSGHNCEEDTDECDSNPCQNGAGCTDGIDEFSCVCPAGYEGRLCETETDECQSGPCRNGASCVDGVGEFSCTCAAGYEGLLCETDSDECDSNPCQNGASCVDGVDEFSCSCAAGYEGLSCETNIDECDSSPCQNDGSCMDGVDEFSCACAAGYKGDFCETDTDECDSYPCQNGASCVDDIGNFSCTCVAGYEGLLCEIDVNECASSPCSNGTCIDAVNGFTCACAPGFEGEFCEINVDECVSNPCQNGGTCEDGINEVVCTCAAGFYGTLCETSCEGDQHECSNGRCIPRSQTCDHYNDCGDFDNSDESNTLCESIYSFCSYTRNRFYTLRELPCVEYIDWREAQNTTLEGATAVYTFTVPHTTSNTTYLNAVRVKWQALVGKSLRNVTLVVNISLPSSSQESVKFIWLGPNGRVLNDLIRVPLRVDSGEEVRLSMHYVADFKSDSSLPVSVACRECVSLRYAVFGTGCGCLTIGGRGYQAWRSVVSASPHIFGTPCGVAERNEIAFSLFDKCFEPPSFAYTSPDTASFLGDVVTLTCSGTGDLPPLVEWRDDKMNRLEAGLSSAYLKVVVKDSPQRFRCVLDGEIFSRNITVAQWAAGCDDMYFNRNLSDYRSASQCYSSHTTTSHRKMSKGSVNFNLDMNSPGIANHLRIELSSDAIVPNIVPLLRHNIQISSPGRRYLLYNFNQEFDDDHTSLETLNHTAVIDLKLVPPVAIEDGPITIRIQTRSRAGMAYFEETRPMVSVTLTLLTCESGGNNCDEFFRRWTELEAAFREAGCGDGLGQEYMAYQQCPEAPRPAPVAVPAPSLMEVPKSDQLAPFPVPCAIDNAASYDWYRIGPGGRRDFVTNGHALIFPTFDNFQDQGVYVCVGRGTGIHYNDTAEYETAVTRSGITTLVSTITLVNETFTEDLRNASSAAFVDLHGRVTNEVTPAIKAFRSMYPNSSVGYDVVRFYPGSVITELVVLVDQEDAEKRASDAELETFLGALLFSRALNSSKLTLDPDSLTVVTLGDPKLVPRLCVGGFFRDCDADVNDQLGFLKNITVTTENIERVAQALASLTADPSFIDGVAVSLVADILDLIVNLGDPSGDVTMAVLMVVDNLLQVNDDVFDEMPDANSGSRIVQALERQIAYVLADGGNFTGVTRSLAVDALNIPIDSLDNGLGFTVTEGKTGDEPLTDDRVGVYFSDSVIPEDEVEASIQLPEAILQKLPTDVRPVPMSFILYQSSKLFRSQRLRDAEAAGTPRSVGGSVIAAEVVGAPIVDLSAEAPVVTTFRKNQVSMENQQCKDTDECVFWDFSLRDGTGDWSGEGCRKAACDAGRTTCHCNHTTSFAVLVDIYNQRYPSFALDIISKIGCGVSIVALAITIIMYLAVRSQRGTLPGRILICFSASLLCLYVVFLAGVEQTSSRAGCIVVAVLLHYFTLTTMAWMAADATSMYLKLVKVLNANVEHFMVKASVAAWGLPMVVVGVILAVDYNVYGNETSCFLQGGPALYFGQLLIIALVLFYNAIIFVLVARKLTCSAPEVQRSSNKMERGKVARRLQNLVAVAVLLGLTWVFGLLAVIEAASFAFQILFSVFNSLQGLFIFLLFVLRQDKIRECLRDLCRRGRWELRDTFSTGPGPRLKRVAAKESNERGGMGNGSQNGSGLAMDQLEMGRTAKSV